MSLQQSLIAFLKAKLNRLSENFSSIGRGRELYRAVFLSSNEGKIVLLDLLSKSNLFEAPSVDMNLSEMSRMQGRRDLMLYILDKINIPRDRLVDLNEVESILKYE